MELISIAKLKSVNSLEKIQALNVVGVYSIRDMAEFDGCRHAELIVAYAEKEQLEELDLENYVEATIDDAYMLTIAQASFNDLKVITDEYYDTLSSKFSIESISDLANFAPYLEAKEIIRNNILGEFYEKPSAPDALLPKIIGSTHTQVGFSNYVKEVEKAFKNFDLNYYADSDEPDPASALIEIFYQSTAKFHLGYLGSIHQKWINMGTHLGEPIHSLALAPGESRNIAIIDWYRRQQSTRGEDTTVSENLRSEFIQTRALNEVVQSTANEHLAGGTEIDANTKTTGYGLVGGLGGGNAQGGASSGSGSLTESLSGMLASVGGALGTGMISSMAGSLGGSLVHSKGTVQGTLKSETSGDREVMGEVVQNITDSTVQNSSNVRSVMSTVVVEDRQSGHQRAQTRNITNYNHSHALNMEYYEVLQTYRIKTGVDSLMPVLFLPFRPIDFDISLIQDYWYLFGRAIKKTNPKKFREYSQVVKDFDPDNTSFDPSGNVRIDQVKITTTKSFSAKVRVELTDSNPTVTLAISSSDLNDGLELTMKGAATYVKHDDVLGGIATFTFTEFNNADSFELDENITANLESTFKSDLEKTMKDYLGDPNKTPKRGEIGLDDNELGSGSNRDNLKQQVDEGKYKLLNKNETLDISFDIEYTLADENQQALVIKQSLTLSYTFDYLYDGFNNELTNVTDFVNTQLTTVADINPTDLIEEIENHFRFHKYGYTKYLLAHLEKEQLIDIIEHLGLSGGAEIVPLTGLIDPNPLGITENLLIFKLKDIAEGAIAPMGQGYNTVLTSPLFDNLDMRGSGFQKDTIKDGRNTMMYQMSAAQLQQGKKNSKAPGKSSNLTLYIDKEAGSDGKYPIQGSVEILTLDKGITHKQPMTISGTATAMKNNKLKVNYNIDTIYGEPVTGDTTSGTLDISINTSTVDLTNIPAVINNYIQTVEQYEEQMRAHPVWSTVFLPTAGVFGEAILGVSNASEYINLRRFYNWQDSPIPNLAPEIQAVNANQDYAQPVSDSLNPTMPVSVLNQMNPQPMPATSLGAALAAIQNGSMFNDMSKTEQLTTVLGTLADLANNTAQLSGNLAGDAAANSLNAAVALGQQVASMIGAAMGSNIASPPETPTAKGGALNVTDPMGDTPTPKEQGQSGVVGVDYPGSNTGSNGTGSDGGGTGGDGEGSGSNSSGGGGTDTGNGAAYDTSETATGTISIQAGLPNPYDYASVNTLEMMDQFIPDDVDQTIYDIYVTLKELVIWVGDDEAKKGMILSLLLKLKKGLATSGWGLVISLLIDVLTSETFIETAEDVLILMYDVIYYFAFPNLGFSGHLDAGTWLYSDIQLTKKKGEAAQVANLTSAPFNNVNYYFGGTPVNSDPNAPAWGIEQLNSAIYINQTVTPASNLTMSFSDHTNDDGVNITIGAKQEMMVKPGVHCTKPPGLCHR